MKYCHFDPVEKVIFADYSNETITVEMLAEVRAELSQILKAHPGNYYTVTNYTNSVIGPGLTHDDLANHLFKIGEIVRGTIRYGNLLPMTSIFLRTTTVRNHYQNFQSHIYKTKEEALAVVKQLMEENN